MQFKQQALQILKSYLKLWLTTTGEPLPCDVIAPVLQVGSMLFLLEWKLATLVMKRTSL